MTEPVLIACCPEHGPVPQRDCWCIGRPVEQVPMIPLAEHEAAVDRVVVLGEKLHEAIDALSGYRVYVVGKPAYDELLSAMKAWDDLMAERFVRASCDETVTGVSEAARDD